MNPTAPLRDQFANVLVVFRQQPCLGQRDQMLMAVQFPGDLVVADDSEVKKRNFEPRDKWRAFAVHAIEMPIDLESIIEVLVAEQAKTMLADFVGLADDCLSLIGQVPPQQLGAFACCAGAEKELSLFRIGGSERDMFWLHSHPVPQQIASLMEFLPAARTNFFPIRVEEARQFLQY